MCASMSRSALRRWVSGLHSDAASAPLALTADGASPSTAAPDRPQTPTGAPTRHIPSPSPCADERPDHGYWRVEAIAEVTASAGSHAYAVAFLTDHRALPQLGTGDVLVCNADETSLATGGTNPHVLRQLVEHGVSVWSRANLHARVHAARSIAFVASANATTSSKRLTEAGHLITDPVEAWELHRRVQSLATPREAHRSRSPCSTGPNNTGNRPQASANEHQRRRSTSARSGPNTNRDGSGGLLERRCPPGGTAYSQATTAV